MLITIFGLLFAFFMYEVLCDISASEGAIAFSPKMSLLAKLPTPVYEAVREALPYILIALAGVTFLCMFIGRVRKKKHFLRILDYFVLFCGAFVGFWLMGANTYAGVPSPYNWIAPNTLRNVYLLTQIPLFVLDMLYSFIRIVKGKY